MATIQQEKIENQLEGLKKIMLNYFPKEFVKIHKKDMVGYCPLGIFCKVKEGKNWLFSINFNFFETEIDDGFVNGIYCLQNIIKKASLIIKNLEFNYGQFIIGSEELEVTNILENIDILDYMEKNNKDFSYSKRMLESKILLELNEKKN